MNRIADDREIAEDLLEGVLEVLRQGESLLLEIDDAVYGRRLPVAFNASIGGHYRHCLDHFRSLLEAIGGTELNYDRRARDPLLETDRFVALGATRNLIEAFAELPAAVADRGLEVTCKSRYASAGSQTATATVGRELMYVVAHAVHHYALIGIMGALQGVTLPAGFGVAPSTVKHQAELERAARSGCGGPERAVA